MINAAERCMASLAERDSLVTLQHNRERDGVDGQETDRDRAGKETTDGAEEADGGSSADEPPAAIPEKDAPSTP